MLVLSRKKDESIVITVDVATLRQFVAEDRDLRVDITTVEIRGDKVRLGANAERRITIHRKEVYDTIIRERQEVLRVSNPQG